MAYHKYLRDFRVPTWSSLAKLHQLKAVQSTYIWLILVPVVAKAFESLEDKANVVVLSYSLQIDLTLPFSWAVLYFSALFFACGNLTYQIACPSIVKENRSYADFVSAGKLRFHLNAYHYEIGGKSLITGQLDEDFWYIFNEANIRHMPLRLISSLVTGAGIVSLVWVLVENLVSIMKILSE